MLARRGIEVDLSKIPLDDVKTYEMLGRGETIGVFQVESAGMRKALVEMRADRIEDLIALVALYRPGPMANIPTYCARKLGEEPDMRALSLMEAGHLELLVRAVDLIVVQTKADEQRIEIKDVL